MIIVVLGIVAAVAVPKMGALTQNSRKSATKSEMAMLKRAIVGTAQALAGGRYVDVGFEGDVGHTPISLQELGVKSDSLPLYNKFTRVGWNGPYVDTTGGEYLTDSWGIAYQYNRTARSITSVGGPDTLVVTF